MQGKHLPEVLADSFIPWPRASYSDAFFVYLCDSQVKNRFNPLPNISSM